MNELYDLMAEVLEYPRPESHCRLKHCLERLAELAPPGFTEFVAWHSAQTLPALQEQYAQTFDLNPKCVLEIGYHVFGENYKRGMFLAHLRQTQAPFKLGQGDQLPDYLPVLLRLAPRLEDRELREDLIAECMHPAIERLLANLREKSSPYVPLLELIKALLQREVPARAVTNEKPCLSAEPCGFPTALQRED